MEAKKTKPDKETHKEESKIDVKFTREYLDATSGKGCYEETNLESPESRIAAQEKLKPLKRFLGEPKNIVSVGVGSGAELVALTSIFKFSNARITGLDLSSKTLDAVKERLDKLHLSATLIHGSAIDMPFPKNSVDIFVEAALLHEIYSYVSDGKTAWKRAIAEVAEKLSENGIFLLRDFSAPHDAYVKLNPKDDFAKNFYSYFIKYYRTFESWNQSELNGIENRRDSYTNDFPNLNFTGSTLISLHKAAEIMLHFRYFYENYMNNTTRFDDAKWKEINETYLIPHPNKLGMVPMSRDEYVQAVLDVANATLKDTDYRLICVQNSVSQRPETAQFLEEHFSLMDDTGQSMEDLFLQISEKMELVFKKVIK